MDPHKLREALRKQGIFVHESDPILEMAAICDVAMTDTLKAIEGIVKAAADRTSAAAAQTVDASRKAGDVLINQGAGFLVEQFREVAREATFAMLDELRREDVRAMPEVLAVPDFERLALKLAVHLILGMNDGLYRPFDQAIFDQFAAGYKHITETLQRQLHGLRITAIVPSPYDDVTREDAAGAGR